MLTRRTVIKTAAALPFTPVFAHIDNVKDINWAVVRECGIKESEEFSNVLSSAGAYIIDVDPDPAQTWREINRMDQKKTTLIAGCTKDATAFVLQELARTEGYRTKQYATHRNTGTGKIEHQLHISIDSTQVGELNSSHWPAAVASLIKADNTMSSSPHIIHLPSKRPASSPGYLISWALQQT